MMASSLTLSLLLLATCLPSVLLSPTTSPVTVDMLDTEAPTGQPDIEGRSGKHTHTHCHYCMTQSSHTKGNDRGASYCNNLAAQGIVTGGFGAAASKAHTSSSYTSQTSSSSGGTGGSYSDKYGSEVHVGEGGIKYITGQGSGAAVSEGHSSSLYTKQTPSFGAAGGSYGEGYTGELIYKAPSLYVDAAYSTGGGGGGGGSGGGVGGGSSGYGDSTYHEEAWSSFGGTHQGSVGASSGAGVLVEESQGGIYHNVPEGAAYIELTSKDEAHTYGHGVDGSSGGGYKSSSYTSETWSSSGGAGGSSSASHSGGEGVGGGGSQGQSSSSHSTSNTVSSSAIAGGSGTLDVEEFRKKAVLLYLSGGSQEGTFCEILKAQY